MSMPPRRRSSAARLLALLALLAVVAGVPAALVGIAGNPVPSRLPAWPDITSALSNPDDGTLFAALLLILAWAGWAVFTLSVLVELTAHLRGRPAPKLPAMRVPQAAAAALVGLLFAAGPQVASAVAETTTATAPAAVTASYATHIDTPAVPAAVGPSAPVPARTYVVRAGDSLWAIAERHLGDGRRFGEIAELNYGVPQSDGRALTDSHWINPGWQLRLPPPAVPAHTSAPHAGTYVVRPGDTLWTIARDRLGDPARFGEIVAASRSITQPGGRRLTDPGVIHVGWTLRIPAAPPPLLSVPQQPSSARPSPAPPAPVSPSPDDGEDLAGQDATAAQFLDDSGEVVPVVTAAGLGALLAAGIIALLAARRSSQQRRRRHGRPIPMPAGAAAAAETELRATADPLSVETVDRALRTLAAHCMRTGRALPVVRTARLTPEQFGLNLAEPADLPAPWTGTADRLVWTMPAGANGLLEEAEARQVPAPYPSLVIIGHDQEDGHVLLDLEYVGALGVSGEPNRTSEVLAAIAVELATSRWADDLQVTIVGSYPELEDALQTGRIRYLPAVANLIEELNARADEDRSILALAGVDDLNQARAEGAAPPAWTPEIVLMAGHVTAHQRFQVGRLVERLPRVAIAVVVKGEPVGEWCLRLDHDAAILEPLGLQIRPQRIDEPTYAWILDLMSVAATDAQEDPAGAEPEEPYELPTPTDLPEPVEELVPTDAPAPDDPVIDLVALEAAAEAAPEPMTPAGPPRLLVLGPVEVVEASGPVEPSKKSRLTELFGYLAFHPGTDFPAIDAAVWPGMRIGPNTRNTAMSKLRRWLGTDENGVEHLPRHQAETGYRLGAQVRTDWDLWCSLLPSGPLDATAEQLEQALRLVRGRPFDAVRTRRYAWAENLKQMMISAIVDASYELARKRLMEGRWRAAEQAVVVGLSLEPGMERLWRVRILAAHASGNPAAEQEAISRMLSVTEDLGGDLEEETERLLRELRDPKVAARDRLAFHAW